MAKVILFGGGDGGGIIFGPEGIKRIPPWNPDIGRGLRAISALSQISRRSALGRTAAQVAEELSTALIPQIVGSVSDVTSVYYAGFDGDWFCGSTGKKPQPVPRNKLLDSTVDPV